MEFKLAIGDPASKRTYKAELKGSDAEKLAGKKIGESFKGELLGLGGYELQITGGSDNAGFPMRRDVTGPTRRKIILSSGVGFNSKRNGLRRRKSIRGNTISVDIVQVNCKVVKAGKKTLADAFGIVPKEAEKKEGEAAEAPKQEAKPEAKIEEKPIADKKEEAPKVEEKPVEQPKAEEKKEKPAEAKKE